MRDFVHLAFFGPEEREQCLFAVLQLAQSLDILVALLDFQGHLLIHLVACLDRIEDSLKVEDLELKPAAH